MLMMAQNPTGAIREVNEAFNGEQAVDYVASQVKGKSKIKRVARRRTQERTAAQTMKDRLAVVDEERDDSMALLPFDDSKEKRRLRNDLKARAHEFSGTHSFRNQATFVTGGGLPRNRPNLISDDKNSDDDDQAILSDEDPEDALLRDVE